MVDSLITAKYVYNSNRLDGVHIAYEQTVELLERERRGELPEPVPVASPDADRSFDSAFVTSHATALQHIGEIVDEPRLTEEHICELHRRLMDGVILSNGEYRECTLRYRHIPPVAPDQIPSRLQRIVAIMNEGYERARDRGVLAWQVHHELIYAHPFIEGNGRLARLVLNLMRRRAGLELEVVSFGQHEAYLRSITEYGKRLAGVVPQAGEASSHSPSGRLLRPPS